MATQLKVGDCRRLLKTIPDGSVHCCVTSPPYFGLRDYGVDGQIGLEPTPEAFVAEMIEVFREVRRVLRDDGTLWLNLGDSYCSTDKWGGGGNVGKQTVAPDGSVPSWRVRERRPHIAGIKPKDLLGIPWMVAFALRADGWYLRQDIIWHKPNAMPDTAQDRPTSVYEHVFLLTKSARYFYNASEAVEPAANGGMKKSRNVWSINTKPSGYGHFATFPVELAERCIREGSQPGDLVLDPFAGAGTVGVAAQNTGRDAVLIELRPEYAAIIEKRLAANAPNNAQEKEIA